jgi:hypothetical protein
MKPNPLKARFLADLDRWLTPELLYHGFTGESDPYELARIADLDHALQSSLLNKVERLWPERLAAIAATRKKEKQDGANAVNQYVLRAVNDHR